MLDVGKLPVDVEARAEVGEDQQDEHDGERDPDLA
jgi:hypothetical protein